MSERDQIISAVKWALLVIGFYAIFSRLWAAEDAYITFRYIRNLLDGNGLVYNIGDRVEGFTHPLWLFLIAIPAYLGVNVRTSALVISLILTMIALAFLLFRIRKEGSRQAVLPIAVALLLTQTGFRDFSVSGLEFPLCCLLLVWFYLSYLRHDLLGKPILHGTLLALLYLTRPELVLLLITFVILIGIQTLRRFLSKKSQARVPYLMQVFKFGLPILILAGGYHLFRLWYYGEFFPNTYYAKDGLGTYWSVGWLYLKHTLHYSPFIMISFLVMIATIVFHKKVRDSLVASTQLKMMLLQIILLTIYVIRIGGDFMAFRFFLPAIVIFAILFEELVSAIPTREIASRYLAVALLIFTAVFVIYPVIAPVRIGYIADERQNYDLYHPAYRALFDEPLEHRWYKSGLEIKALQERSNYPISIGAGNVGYFGYAAGPKINIVDVYGLVDRETARNWEVVTERGRPGHEKKLTLPMAIARDVTIFETPSPKWNEIMDTPFGTIITLDPAFLKFYPEKITALKRLKAEIASSPAADDGSGKLMQYLETKYHLDIDSL